VNSRNGDQKVSNAANANSSSTKCKPSKKSASVFTDLEEEESIDREQLLAYPNPVTDKVYISMEGIENHKMLALHDLTGRLFPVSSMEIGTNKLEIDLRGMPSGHYIVRIVMRDGIRLVPLIKH
jgi:hypothetical protein